MTANNTGSDMNKHLFIGIVTTLGMSAMQHLGKIVNPQTGKAAVDLDAASATIDTLDMLSAKTRGNLDGDEERLLRDTLSSLKLNFVETRDEEERKKAHGSKGTACPNSPGEAQSDVEKSEPKSAPEQSNDPKFHKSYG